MKLIQLVTVVVTAAAAASLLPVTRAQATDKIQILQNGENLSVSLNKPVNITIEEDLHGGPVFRARCRQNKKCKKKGGQCQTKGTCEGPISKRCSKTCDCCLPLPPISTADQCKDLGGFCVASGGQCNCTGIIHILVNSVDDFCVCCVPKGTCVLGGKAHAPGTKFENNCMTFFCENGNWLSTNEYKGNCGECQFNNDPHFTTFDGLRFDWHGKSSYIISQEGCENCPETFVASLFDDCVSGYDWATCVDTVYFQPQPGTFIEIVKANTIKNSQIIIGTNTQDLSSLEDGEILILKGDAGVEYPALAWWHSLYSNNDCIYIMGFNDHGYLVMICRWRASIFTYSTMRDSLCGLCGNWDNDKTNDIMFRDGTTLPPPPQQGSWEERQIEPVYGEHWTAEELKDCPSDYEQIVSRDSPKLVNPCKATKSELDVYIRKCKDNGIGGEVAEECALDQCVAESSGDKSLPSKWLRYSKITFLEIQQQKKDTVEHKEECVYPWINITICILIVEEKKWWRQASDHCKDKGGELAILDTLEKRKAAVNYFDPSEASKLTNYWIGAQDEFHNSTWTWLNNEPVIGGWASRHPSKNRKCMYIYPKRFNERYNVFYSHSCEGSRSRLHFICEK